MQTNGNIHESIEKYGVKKKRTGHIKNTYSRYFEGYTETVVLQKNKKTCVRRFYVGDYYRQALSDRQFMAVKAVYLLAFLLAAAVFLISGTRAAAVNRLMYIALLQAFCVFFLGWTGIALLDYVPAHRKLTIYEYKTFSKSLIRGTCGLFISAGLLSACSVLYILRYTGSTPEPDAMCVLGNLFVTLAAGTMNWMERKIVYEQIPCRNQKEIERKDI